MASSSHHSEAAKTEQIITEFFAKSLHIVLESRSPSVSSHNYSGEQILSSPSPSSSSSSSSSMRPRDKWFNLALRECPAALENLDFWRESNVEPMVVDVVLVKKPVDFDPVCSSPRGGVAVRERFPTSWNSRQEEFLTDMKSEKIIERWIVQYENGKKSKDSNKVSKRGGSNTSQSLYKKSIILLRSLYLTVRILPAYKLYRDLNSSGKVNTFSLAHRVSSFVEPFTHREEAEMHQFAFTPVETSCGRLCLSVLYRPTLSDVNLEASTPMSPQFIPDYVGSPTTNPLKRFPSLPNFAPLISPSPSPTHSDSRAFSYKLNSQLVSSQHHPPENPYSCNASLPNKNTSYDDYWPSPMFSPSPSPSPPTHFTANHLSKALLRSESAPVSIPTAKLGPALPSNHVPPLSPSPRGTKLNSSSQIDNTKALTKLGDISSGITTQKISTFGKDEAGNLSGAKLLSHSSARPSFSRIVGRVSFQDEFDDSEFCPFAVDDIDTSDPRLRAESFDPAVVSVVHMLKTAPPLRQDFSNSKMLQVSKPEILNKSIQEPRDNLNSEAGVVQNPASNFGITSSGLLMLKTTSEALEELQSYRSMKEKLLKQGSEYRTLANVSHAADTADKCGV